MRLSQASIYRFTIALAIWGISCHAVAQVDPSTCGDFRSHLQWDYRTASERERREVEGAHFPPEVEGLIRGHRGPLGADLSYTLGASPNHHRALVAITRWSERLKSTTLPYLAFPVECYFIRGLNFTPDDEVLRMLYAQFLILWKRPSDAAKQLEYVASKVAGNPFTVQNIGLIYFDMKDYAQALAYAHKALAMGFTNSRLSEALKSISQWREPEAGATAPFPAASGTTTASPTPARSSN